MSSRRGFLKKASILGLGAQLASHCPFTPVSLESSWSEISSQFFKNPEGILNFNTGSAGMMPIPVYDEYIENVQRLAQHAAYEVKSEYDQQIIHSMSRIAELIDVEKEQLSLVRNATEGINTVLNGYPFQENDEVVISGLAYPYVKARLKTLKKHKGIKINTVSLNGTEDDGTIVQRYSEKITDATILIITTAMTHQLGLLMPVGDIVTLAKSHNIKVLVDGAHCVGQFHVNLLELGCDYFVTSLHKWYSAPLGTGLLYIKEGEESRITSTFSSPRADAPNLKKFDYTGTVAFQNAMTLKAVVDFQESIGTVKKYKRIKALGLYMMDHLSEIPGLVIHSDKDRCAGIISFSCIDAKPSVIIKQLENEYKVHLKTTSSGNKVFIRASANIHLLESDIDYLVSSLTKILA